MTTRPVAEGPHLPISAATASGLALFGVGSAVWGLGIGFGALGVTRYRTRGGQ